jgi:hypothetical protein
MRPPRRLFSPAQINCGSARRALNKIPQRAFAVLLCHSRGGTFARMPGTPAFTVTYGAMAAKVVHP